MAAQTPKQWRPALGCSGQFRGLAMFTRRRVLELGLMSSASFLPWPLPLPRALARAPGQVPDSKQIPKYVMPLVVPPAMPRSGTINSNAVDYYAIGVRQFRQQILPPSLPQTTVWSYGSIDHPSTFNYPAFTIEAETDRPVRVKWANELVDDEGHFLPHILAADPTLHWANPPGGIAGRDSRPSFHFHAGSLHRTGADRDTPPRRP